MGIAKSVDDTTKTFIALMVLGIAGLLFLIVMGNLSTNLGFADNTAGSNNTEQVIGNLSGGAVTFFSFSNVWFTLLAIVLLIIIVISVIKVVQGTGGGKGFSS